MKLVWRMLAGLILILIGVKQTLPAQSQIGTKAFIDVPGSLTSENLQLVGQIGGLGQLVMRNGALIALAGQQLQVFQVSSPNHPYLIGQSSLSTGSALDLALEGDFAYIAAGPAGLHIIDLSNPRQPRSRGNFSEPSQPWFSLRKVAVSGGIAFLEHYEGLAVLNVSNPDSPHLVGNYFSPGGNALAARENALYRGVTGIGFHVLNGSNPAALQHVATVNLATVEHFAVDGNRLFVAAGSDGLRIYDISNPLFPTEIGHYDSYITQIAVSGNRAYVRQGVFILALDISNPAVPVVLGKSDGGTSSLGSLAARGNEVFANTQGRLEVYSIAASSDPILLVSQGLQTISAISVSNNMVYATHDAGLSIINGSDLNLPNVSGEVGRRFLNSLAVSGNTIYVGDAVGNLLIVAADDLNTPYIAGRYILPGTLPGLVAGANSRAYLASGSILHVFDTSNRSQPQQLSSTYLPFYVSDIQLVGNRLYVAGETTLAIYGISAAPAPILLGSYTAPDEILDISIVNMYAFVATGNSGLRIVNTASPALPLEIAAESTIDAIRVAAGDTLAFVSGQYRLWVFDVTTPTTPQLSGFINLMSANSLVAVGDLVYVGTGNTIQIFRFQPALTATVGPEGGTVVFSSDGVSYLFPENAFSSNTIIQHTPLTRAASGGPSSGVVARVFDVAAFDAVFTQPVQNAIPYTLTVSYTEASIKPATEDSLTLYQWDGSEWALAAHSAVDPASNTVTATGERLAKWALVGTASHQVFLPAIARDMAISDPAIVGLEITQAIQNEQNSVPLIAERSTVLRVYAETKGQVANDLFLEIRATRNGVPLPQSPLQFGPWAVYRNSDRGVYARSFNLNLPASWLSGEVVLTAILDPDEAYIDVNRSNNIATLHASFNAVSPLHIRLIPTVYTHTPTGVVCSAPAIDVISDEMRRLYPLHEVQISFREAITFNGDMNIYEEMTRYLTNIQTLKQLDGAPESMVYYGVFATRNDTGGVCPAIRGGRGYIGQRASIGIFDVPSILAHEIGHNFGRRHVDCGNPPTVDPNYPYAEGSIYQYGFDAMRHRIWTPGGPDYTKDFMSYCGPEWVSDYTYRALYEDQLRYTGLRATVVDHLVVRAQFDDSGFLSLQPIYVIPAPWEPYGTDSIFTIALLDAAGQVVTTMPAPVYEIADGPGEFQELAVRIPLPTTPVFTFQLLRNGQIIAERSLEITPPQRLGSGVTQKLSEGQVEVRWESRETPALVRVSYDGAVWTTLAFDILENSLWVDPLLIPDSAQIEVNLAVDR